MAARRLLIVLLLLLGVSTLAAALVPPRSLRDETSSETTTTTTERTDTAAPPRSPVGSHFPVTITVGGKRVPVVACPPAKERTARCEPIRVGDRMTLTVRALRPAQLEIPSFGLIGFAAPSAPAIFELVFDSAADYGIRFTDSGKIAARIQVLTAGARRRARAGSNRA